MFGREVAAWTPGFWTWSPTLRRVLARLGNAGRSEAGAEADGVGPEFHQAAVEHAGDDGRDLGLPGLRAMAPDPQPDVVSEAGSLAEVDEELVAEPGLTHEIAQVAQLGCAHLPWLRKRARAGRR
jgi:hypothetical protein